MCELQKHKNNFFDLLNIDILKIIEKHYLKIEDKKYIGALHHFISIKIYIQDPILFKNEGRSLYLDDYYREIVDDEEDEEEEIMKYWKECLEKDNIEDFDNYMLKKKCENYFKKWGEYPEEDFVVNDYFDFNGNFR